MKELMLGNKAAARGLAALDAAGCLPYVFFDTLPDLAAAKRLSSLPVDPALRLAALLHDHTPAEAAGLCRRLRTSNAFCDRVTGLLDAVRDPLPDDAYTARRYVCRHFLYRKEALCLLAALQNADVTAAAEQMAAVVRDRTAVDLRHLAVTGLALQEEAGVRPADTAKMLAALQDRVWRDPAENKKELLISAARILYRKGEF